MAVEATYNWYWLVDGLEEEGYKVHLPNPSAIKQYDGLKRTDDNSDSFRLAHMKCSLLGVVVKFDDLAKSIRSSFSCL